MKCDVAIVGGGPSGSTVAEVVAREGGDVVILEEHPEVGVPQHCTGKISVNALKDLELELEVKGVLNRVRGAVFHSPRRTSISTRRCETQALVLDRRAFDQELSDKAVEAGAGLLTETRVKGFSMNPSGATLQVENGGSALEVEARLIVGADGAASKTARQAGIYSKDFREVRIGIQREVAGIQIVPDMVELFFGKDWAPGFFAWIVPKGGGEARVGLALEPKTAKPASEYLSDFMENHPVAKERLGESRVLKEITHLIPTGGGLQKTTSNGVLVVGDAAGQVKSTTGGGLYYGMACSKIAGRWISRALKNSSEGLLREEELTGYEEEWRARFGGEIAFTVRARRFLDSLSDGEVEYLFKALQNDRSLMQRVMMEGDVDFQSRAGFTMLRSLKHLVKKPGLMYKLMKFFPYP